MAPDPALQALVNEWLAGASAAGVPARELERAMQAYVHDTAAP
jgi:thiamine biosynthesis lipoprotein ApbE